MIQPASSEATFQALFTLLAASTVGGSAAFVSTSRRLPAIANVLAAQQPALYMLEGEEDVAETDQGLPVQEWRVAAVVLFQSDASPHTIASTKLNNLRDAVVNQLRNFTLSGPSTVIPKQPGERQTLGGLCYHARIIGKVLKNEGLQNQQGAIVFPISILTGM